MSEHRIIEVSAVQPNNKLQLTIAENTRLATPSLAFSAIAAEGEFKDSVQHFIR